VEVKKEPPIDELSDAEIALIDETFEQYGRLSRWELRDLHHKLPEYVDPGDSHIPISCENILKALGKTETEVAAIVRELKYLETTHAVLDK
jgi:hypothetical protein